MRGRIIDFAVLRGKQILSVEIYDDFTEKYESLKGQEVRIDIKKWFEKRSLDANAYLHVLLGEIAEHDGVTMDEVKRRLVVDYGTMQRDAEGNAVYVILPENVDVTQFWEYAKFCYRKYADHQNVWILYKHSSDMDSKEFNRLIEGVISEAKERGIETLTPNELARLKGYVR